MDKALAKCLGELIQVAYAQVEHITQPMPAGEWVIETTLHVTEWGSIPFGFCASINGDLYVACRGTHDLIEWMEDANIVLVPVLGGHSCAGFELVTAQIIPQMNAVIERVKPKNLYITGHSLGGAVATQLMRVAPNAVGYTFCAPRSCDRQLAAFLKGRNITRIFNSEDAVPTLPYGPALYEHVGVPLAAQFNTGDPSGNHSLPNLLAALGAA